MSAYSPAELEAAERFLHNQAERRSYAERNGTWTPQDTLDAVHKRASQDRFLAVPQWPRYPQEES